MGEFKMNTDGVISSFMYSIDGGLYVGCSHGKGIIQSIHRVEFGEGEHVERQVQGGLVLKRRVDSPLFERIVLQWKDILIACLKMNHKMYGEIIESKLVDLALALSKAEEFLIDYLNAYNTAVNKIENGGVDIQQHGINYDDPTMELKDIACDFLIKIVIAIRKLPKILTITSGKTIGTKTIISDITSLLPESHPAIISLEQDRIWLKEIYDIRGEAEHGYWRVNRFEVKKTAR